MTTSTPPEVLISVDPGKRVMGAAVFYYGKLVKAKVLTGREKGGKFADCWRELGREFDDVMPIGDALAYEMPQIWKGGKNTNPDHILDLIGVLGAISHSINLRHAKFHAYRPGQWTKSKKKHVRQPLVIKRLSKDKDEVDVLRAEFGKTPQQITHAARRRQNLGDIDHVLDAIGVGLYHLRRL